jgi:hypothetical protein
MLSLFLYGLANRLCNQLPFNFIGPKERGLGNEEISHTVKHRVRNELSLPGRWQRRDCNRGCRPGAMLPHGNREHEGFPLRDRGMGDQQMGHPENAEFRR